MELDGDDGIFGDVARIICGYEGHAPYALAIANANLLVLRLPGAYADTSRYAERRITQPGDPYQVVIDVGHDEAFAEAERLLAQARELAKAPLN